jgi:hypothetical protein
MAIDQSAYEAAKTKNVTSKSAKEVKEEADQSANVDLDLSEDFEAGRQFAIAKSKAFLSGYHQTRLEISGFIKSEVSGNPAVLKSASYDRLALPPERSESFIRSLFYGEDDE